MQNGCSRSWRFKLLVLGSAGFLSLATFAWPALPAQEPEIPNTAPATQTSGSEFKLRLERNVVVVRVVVRDKKGRAVNGLRKEDFRILDNKKPQVISGFSVETPETAGLPAQPSSAAPVVGPKAVAPSEAPLSYLAFYFDDLYSKMSSLVRSREAAEKFIVGLPSTERVAIFTSSGTQTLDFTDDRQKIHEALMKLRVNTHVNPGRRCPEISDYLARQIVDYGDNAALAVVTDEAVNVCHWSRRMASNTNLIREQAREAYDAYRYQALAVLKNLEAVIDRVALLPGDRQVMLVSDGFINLGRGNRVESLVDRALHARVTVSALDGKGLALNMSDLNAKRSYAPSGDLGVQADMYNSSREVDATGTLAEIADGTGGQFFHGDNNLLVGMRKILLPPEFSYVLTFSPSELKADGAFHALKVTLSHGHGLSVQARKGYYAPTEQVSPEELARNDIREAMYSPYPIQGLPLTVQTETSKTDEQNEKVVVHAQLDIRTLPFEKKDDRSVDDVVFAVGLFDHDGKYVTGRQFTYSLALKDDKRAEIEKTGLSLKTNVSAKAKAYNLRVVVRDSQGGRIAALSKVVDVPSKTSSPAAQQITSSEREGTSGAQGEKTTGLSKAADVLSPNAAPAAKHVDTPGQDMASGAQGKKTAASNKAAEVRGEAYPPMATLDVAPGELDTGDKPYFQAYRHAKPLTHWPLKKVLHRIPELKGLQPATDQSQLTEILLGVSANLQKFVVNFVDTTAVENIDESETAPYWGEFVPYPSQHSTKHIRQKFDYLILRHQEGGAFNIVEYRTDLHGQKERRQKQSTDFIKTAGFAAMPLFFGPLQQPWSEFRYLGRQNIDGVESEVVVFAEHVDTAAVMGHFVLGGESVPLLVQGVAWIRPGDNQILQMRTDLLASLPPLTRMTAVVHFSGFHIQGSPTPLWLPKEVQVKVEFGGYVFANRHRYSDYRMFRAKSVIRAGTPAAQQH